MRRAGGFAVLHRLDVVLRQPAAVAVIERRSDGGGLFWRPPVPIRPKKRPEEHQPVSHRKEDEVAAAWALLMSDPW